MFVLSGLANETLLYRLHHRPIRATLDECETRISKHHIQALCSGYYTHVHTPPAFKSYILPLSMVCVCVLIS